MNIMENSTREVPAADIPYLVLSEGDKGIMVRMRPGDTEGNFRVSNYELIKVEDSVLLCGETRKRDKHFFELNPNWKVFKQDGSLFGTVEDLVARDETPGRKQS